MGREPRFELGFDVDHGHVLLEREELMSETRLRRLFRPIARLISNFRYEPVRDDWYVGIQTESVTKIVKRSDRNAPTRWSGS